jgi:hypothetical protein
MKAIVYVLIGAGAFVFGVTAFIAGSRGALWARYAWLFVGVLGLACGSLGYLLEHYRASLHYSAQAYLDHYRTLVGGIVLGAFVVLLISGQLKSAVKTGQ